MFSTALCIWVTISWKTNCLWRPKNLNSMSSVSFMWYVTERWQVRTDPEKIQVVAEWPKHMTLKQLQWLLDFANIYCCFFRDYRQVAVPLSKLTSPSTPFSWTTGRPCLHWTQEMFHLHTYLGLTWTSSLVHHGAGCLWHGGEGSHLPELHPRPKVPSLCLLPLFIPSRGQIWCWE